MKPHRSCRVLAAIDLSSAAGRQKLAGVHRFLAEGYDWDLELIRTREECTAERITAAANDGIDGFIMAIPESREMHRLHRSLGIPTAFIDYPDAPSAARNSVANRDNRRPLRLFKRQLPEKSFQAPFRRVDARIQGRSRVPSACAQMKFDPLPSPNPQ